MKAQQFVCVVLLLLWGGGGGVEGGKLSISANVEACHLFQLSVSDTDRERTLTSLSPVLCAVTYRENVTQPVDDQVAFSSFCLLLPLSAKPKCALNLKPNVLSSPGISLAFQFDLLIYAAGVYLHWFWVYSFISTFCTSCISSVWSTSVQINV